MNETQGARLKKVRLQKGLTLEQAQKATKINTHILQALEGDGITNISPVYLKSFLRIYCTYLGVDPKDYVADYRQTQYTVKIEPVSVNREKMAQEQEEQRRQKRHRAQQEPPKPQKTAVAKKAHAAAKTFLHSSTQKLKGKSYLGKVALTKMRAAFKKAGSWFSSRKISQEVKMGIVTIAVLIVLVVGLVKLVQVTTRKVKAFIAHRKTAVTETSKTQGNTERGTVEASVPAVKPPAESAPAAPAAKKEEPIKLVIRANQNCWVYLKADGKVVFQRILEKGRFETWTAQDKMELSLGNAGGVELEVNGKVFKNLGRSRESLKSIEITKEGMQIN